MNVKSISEIGKILSSEKRVQIIEFVGYKKEPQSLGSISKAISAQIFSTSQHIDKLEKMSLISKTKKGYFVFHSLTKRGVKLAKILKALEKF